MEIDELKFLSHLFLVLDLLLLLDDSALEGDVLGLQLVDELFLLLKFVKHILGKLFGVVLTYATVLGSTQETAEVEGLFPDLSNGKIRALEDGLETLKQGLRLLATLLDVLLEIVELAGRNVILLLSTELELLISLPLFELAHLLLHLLVADGVLFALPKQVRLKELVLTLDLLVVLLHGFEALHKLLDGEGLQVHVWRIQIGRLVCHFV